MAKKPTSPIRRILDPINEAIVDYGTPVVREIGEALGFTVPRAPRPKLKVTPKAKPKLAVKPLALPAPPKQLALPAPEPGLPSFAVKPRGGQWWANKDFGYSNTSPEAAAQSGASPLALEKWVPEAEGVLGYVDRQVSPAQQWLEKALTKYYKNDFGTAEDPLRDLAARGLHYDPEMTPETWQKTVNDYLIEDRIGDITLPKDLYSDDVYPGVGDEFTTEARMAMPWLSKLPVTDKLYGILGGGLDLGHFTDEFLNALGDPGASGLPMDFAIRPESLGRMTFPQAVEHVGKINQYRAKEMERAALDAQNNPVTHVFKDYADDNPMGLKWVEMAPPKGDGPTNYDVEEELRKALKYEGDTMGHCVGGYCPDVMSGKSRIFSLRDAKGEPHVTIETAPNMRGPNRDERNAIYEQARQEIEALNLDDMDTENLRITERQGELSDAFRAERAANPPPERIVQIKGKQNRAPKEDYIPFVQDFVKSGKWGEVDDLANAGLVMLPDGRFITQQQFDAVVGDDRLDDMFQSYDFNARGFPRDPRNLSEDAWEQFQRHFEGYAIGGRVDANRDFSYNPFTVRRGR